MGKQHILMKFFKKSVKYKYQTILLAYIIGTIIIQCGVLNQTPYASGTDGYYYAYQVASMHKKGAFSLPESSLTIYYLYICSLFVKNIVLSNKIAVSLLKGLFTFGIYLTATSMYNKKSGLCAAFIASGSLMINFFTIEYSKELGGLVLFLFFLHALLVADRKSKLKYYLIALALFFASILSHKLIAALSIMVLFFFLINKLKPTLALTVTLLSILCFFLLSMLLPNVLHYLDFLRFKDYFSPAPHLQLLSFFKLTRMHLVSKIEVTLLFCAPLLLFPVIFHKYKKNMFIFHALCCMFIICVNPFANMDSYDLAFRLFILIGIPSSFCLALLAINMRFRYLLLLLVLMLPLHIYNAVTVYTRHQHNYELYADIIPLLNLPAHSLLIVHQGFDYLYWYQTGKKAFHYLPEKKHLNRPLYRLAYGIKKELLEKYARPGAEIRYLPGFYVLLKEQDWQSFLNNIPLSEKTALLTWRNPHTHRASFLLRNQKFRHK